jgi:hypothetical protein
VPRWIPTSTSGASYSLPQGTPGSYKQLVDLIAGIPKELEFSFQTEPIVAYRLFGVADYQLRHGGTEPRLVPIAQSGKGIIYPTFKRFEAQCVHGLHEAPWSTCSCGVWALKNESDLPTTAAAYGSTRVWGEVYLWGRVLEGALGYRAQYAYPKALKCADPELAAQLQVLYGVPTEVVEPIAALASAPGITVFPNQGIQIQTTQWSPNTTIPWTTTGRSYIPSAWSTGTSGNQITWGTSTSTASNG